MSGLFMKAVATALVAVILSGIFKRDSGSIAMAMISAAGILILTVAAALLQPVLEEVRRLADSAQVSHAYLQPILKCTGIGIVTQIAVGVCRDAGESALASALELCGCILVLFLSLPLFGAVLELIEELMRA